MIKNKFKLVSDYSATFDQKSAINTLTEGIKNNLKYQVLLGVTGSGKTFTVANIIEKLQRPTLIISHNKTLAAQLYQEFRDFFPNNAVSYFVSYYDYYQPEAYIPSTDTYIEKDADVNELIDKLRLSSTKNILTRKDTIVIASVSCIYNIGSPKEYAKFIFEFREGMQIKRDQIFERLINLQYERSNFDFIRGSFRVRGDMIDIYPSYIDEAIRIYTSYNKIVKIQIIDPTSGNIKNTTNKKNIALFPAKHFITDPNNKEDVFKEIRKDLNNQLIKLNKDGRFLEANRLKQKVNYDLEMIKEVGYVKGIENYSRYFDGRHPGEAPYSLLDYFNHSSKNEWLVIVDESHITFPQIRGMYSGDLSRKNTLINYGFRLPSALDNRPLRSEEFLRKIPNFIATSATPSEWEISMANEYSKNKKYNVKNYKGVTEQLLRPTGIPDPKVEIRPVIAHDNESKNQIEDVITEVKKRIKLNQRTLITTLTKQTAEDLANYLKEKNIKVHYLHSDVKTLERTDILDDLRKGNYDCLVGINLLREGLDLPEVSLVAILDADKEGFLRSEVTLIQTMGRAARHVDGMVILYADKITNSIKKAINEVKRRRRYQLKMNKLYNIEVRSISKPIRKRLIEEEIIKKPWMISQDNDTYLSLDNFDIESLTPNEKQKLIGKLKTEMRIAASDLNFELAIQIRDKVRELTD